MEKTKRIIFGCDHAGYKLKEELKKHVELMNTYIVEDVGCYNSEESVDYPVYALAVCKEVLKHDDSSRGIIVCGSGIGVSIAANKVNGIRCAKVEDYYSAKMAIQHNNANVITLGERTTGVEVAKSAIDAFLTHEFLGGKHQKRIDMFSEIEKTQTIQQKNDEK